LVRIAPGGRYNFGNAANISPLSPGWPTLADTLSFTRGKRSSALWRIRFNEVDLAQQQFTRGQIDFLDFKSFLIGSTSISTLETASATGSQRAIDCNLLSG